MNRIIGRISETWWLRHLVFWLCWVTGFTFIKSFGENNQVYLGWITYYVLTLPIFMSHTYIVAYYLIPRFLSWKGLPLFLILFSAFFYAFSVLELLLSHEVIFRWFPGLAASSTDYLGPANVVISGVGNMYVILVFIAARTIRKWQLASLEKRDLERKELQVQMAETMTRVQPLMLLYAIDHIEKLVEESSTKSARAIAMTSELLNEVMIYHEENRHWIPREIGLIQKLVELVALFRGKQPEVEFFISGDPGTIDLPPMILFSLVDLLIRRFDQLEEYPEINIEASGFSNMISLQVLKNGSGWNEAFIEDCVLAIRQLEGMYGRGAEISLTSHKYGCSVMVRKVRNGEQTGTSGGSRPEAGVDSEEPAGG